MNKVFITAVVLALFATAETTQKIGNTYFHSNGSITQKVGDTFFNSSGSSTQKVGNSYFHSNGEVTQKIGDTFYITDQTMKANREEMLQDQHRLLEREYKRYRSGEISEKEYLRRAKPIDEAIGNMEMATLRDTLVSKGSSSPCTPKRESWGVTSSQAWSSKPTSIIFTSKAIQALSIIDKLPKSTKLLLEVGILKEKIFPKMPLSLCNDLPILVLFKYKG